MVAQELSIRDLSETFQQVRMHLNRSWHSLRTQTPGQWAEQQLVASIIELWPGNPVLFKWVPKSLSESAYSRMDILSHEDDPVLPLNFVSMNGLDGLPFYNNKLFQFCAVMACLVRNGKPYASMVMMLDRDELFHAGIRQDAGVYMGTYSHAHWHLPKQLLANSLIGIDATPVASSEFQDLVIGRLLKSDSYARTVNVSPGVGAMGVLGGQLAAYVAYNPYHCDIAATATLCQAAGQVVRYLDGTVIAWRRSQHLFPVVFARDLHAFEFVRQLSEDFLEREQQSHAY